MPVEYVEVSSYRDPTSPDTPVSKFQASLPKCYDNVKAVRLVSAEFYNTVPLLSGESIPGDVTTAPNFTLYFSMYNSLTQSFDEFREIRPGQGLKNPITNYPDLIKRINNRFQAINPSPPIRCVWDSVNKRVIFYANQKFKLALSVNENPTRSQTEVAEKYGAMLGLDVGKDGTKQIESDTYGIDTDPIFTGGNTFGIISSFPSTGGADNVFFVRVKELGDLIQCSDELLTGYFHKLVVNDVNYAEHVVYNSSEANPLYKYYGNNPSFSKFSVEVVNAQNELIDFEGQPIHLTFEIRYGDEPAGDPIYEYFKMQLAKTHPKYPFVSSFS